MRFRQFDVMLEVLTPLHIGAGEEWSPEADFVVEQQGRLVRLIDVPAALMSMTQAEIAAIRGGRIAAALGERRRQQHTIALLPVRSPGNVGRVRAMQRLADGRPYIPGTTVKGSIRTALLQALADAKQLQRLPLTDRDARTAARPLEERSFSVELGGSGRRGDFPNRDINRAVRVSDFLPRGEVPVAVVNMSAHRLGGPGGPRSAIPIWCEAVEPGARFYGTITLEMDSALWRAMDTAQRERVDRLFTTWSTAGQRLLEAERAAWGPDAPDATARFLREALERREIHAQLGWGGGWRSKTLGSLIPQDRLPAIAQQYGLHRWRGREFPRRFPVTRKLAHGPGGPVPPGWVRVLRKEA